MPHTTTSPEGFTDHHDQPFIETWALLEYLTCLAPADTTSQVDALAELTWAHAAYTDNGQRRPAVDVDVHVPGGQDMDVLIDTLEQLLATQLGQAAGDLDEALRLRRTTTHVARAQKAIR